MKLVLKIVLGLILLVVVAVGGFLAYVAIDGIPTYKTEKIDLKVESTPERVARGKTISSMLCKQCHFDDNRGKLSGHRMLDLPADFGLAYSRNITQDKEHGIGNWTDGEIAYLLRTGIKRDGRYAPPWMVKLPRIAEEDIYSIIAYLRSGDSEVQASAVPDTESAPSFLVKFLTHVAFKPFPYPTEKPVAPPITEKAAYGKYLVQNMAGCYQCHSANFKSNDDMNPEKSKGYMGGGNALTTLDGHTIYTANLTPDPETGIGKWSEEDFLKSLRTGLRPDGRPMRLMSQTPEFTDEEIRAIYAYLRTIPAVHNEVNRNFPDLGGAAADGKAVYVKYGCSACHGESGVGIGDLTRAKVDFPEDSSVVAWIKNPPAFKPMTKMPPFGGVIKEEEFAPLVAYVRELGKKTP
jgi:mono/diheme cytochrome c family protein